MKISVSEGIGNQEDVDGLKRQTQIFAGAVEQILNNGISFKDNFRSQIIPVTFTTANVDTQIIHQLNYVPTGYLVIQKSVSLDIYNGTNTFNKAYVTLRSTVVGTATVVIF